NEYSGSSQVISPGQLVEITLRLTRTGSVSAEVLRKTLKPILSDSAATVQRTTTWVPCHWAVTDPRVTAAETGRRSKASATNNITSARLATPTRPNLTVLLKAIVHVPYQIRPRPLRRRVVNLTRVMRAKPPRRGRV